MNWQMYNRRGPRAEVRAAVKADETVPEAVREYLLALIDGLPAECYGVVVNGFGVTNAPPGQAVTLNHQVTVVGMR